MLHLPTGFKLSIIENIHPNLHWFSKIVAIPSATFEGFIICSICFAFSTTKIFVFGNRFDITCFLSLALCPLSAPLA